MRLSLRARLTLWYSLILLLVLLAGGLAVVWVHATLGLERLDSELRDRAATVAASLRAEFDEAGVEADGTQDSDLTDRSVEGLEDLDLPGTGIAIMSPAGQVFAVRSSGVSMLAPGELQRIVATGSDRHGMSFKGVRVYQSIERSRKQEFRVVIWASLAGYERERGMLIKALWLGVLLALVVASLGGWLIGERGLRPLRMMARQAEGITPDHPDERLTATNKGDELDVLASAFNGLLDRLAGALRMQRQFMAEASHQLRTPTSIARITAQVTLSGSTRDAGEYREALSTIDAQTRRLTTIIERMFTLALADLDARPLQLSDLYLNDLVDECARAARVLGVDRQVGVRVAATAEVPYRGDEGLLREMTMNLVENAIRHTPRGSTIDLALTADRASIRLSVRDTGPGIPEADRARIFARFVRLETAESAGGGGLGLPIALWVARAHGGSLTLESSGPEGTCFVVTLPIGHHAAAPS